VAASRRETDDGSLFERDGRRGERVGFMLTGYEDDGGLQLGAANSSGAGYGRGCSAPATTITQSYVSIRRATACI